MRPGTSARRSISSATCASGRRAARRGRRGPSRARRRGPGRSRAPISISAASASITVTLRSPSRRACAATSAARPGSSSTEIVSPRSPIRAAIWPVLIPGPGAEVEDVLARAAGRAPRRPPPSRGSAGSARRRRPGPGRSRRCAPRSRSTRAGPAARARRPAPRSPRRRPPVKAWSSNGEHAPPRSARRVDSHRDLRPARCRRRAASGRLGAQLLPPHPRQPERRRVGDRGGLGGRVVAEQRRGQLGALAGRAAQHRVDEARGVGGAGPLDQLDRLVDGGVVGRAVGEEQLVEAEPQRGQHRRVEQAASARRAVRSPRRWCRGAGRRRRRAAAPGRARGRRPRAAGGLAEGALGEGALLEGRPDGLEGELRPCARSRSSAPAAGGRAGRRRPPSACRPAAARPRAAGAPSAAAGSSASRSASTAPA